MNATKNAIALAIKGGWKSHAMRLAILNGVSEFGNVHYEDGTGYATTKRVSEILLDSDFWRCLGKGAGWDENYYHWSSASEIRGWGDMWHALIDHLADNGTPETYFESLNLPEV